MAQNLGFTSKDVEEVIRSKVGTDDFTVVSWDLKSLMEDGKLGFLGDHYHLVCSVKHPANSSPKSMSFFVKTLPANEVQKTLVIKNGAMRKERLFFELLAKEFAELVGEDRGPGFQPFIYPACHLTKENLFVLDDLGPSFKSLEGQKPMPLDFVQMVVRDMARFHAASLVMEERRGKKINEIYPELDYEVFFHGDPSHPCANWHNASFKLAVNAIPHLDKYKNDSAKVKQIQQALPKVMEELFPSMRAWPNKRNVMVHGDLWINNLMFRCENGKPVELSIVDFQLLRYTVPAHDLTMFVMFCTDKAFQDKHMDELIHLYWNSLAAVIRKAGYDADAVLPLSEFVTTMKDMKKFGVIQMAMELPLALAPSYVMDPVLSDPVKYQQHFNVDRSETILKMYYDEPMFRYRWTEALEQLIDTYILKD